MADMPVIKWASEEEQTQRRIRKSYSSGGEDRKDGEKDLDKILPENL